MKVLSEWYRGTPPMPGMWIVRTTMAREWDGGSMCVWDGAQFTDLDGTPIRAALTNVEYRGLAFDPEKASAIDVQLVDARGKKCGKFQCAWIVPVPDEEPKP